MISFLKAGVVYLDYTHSQKAMWRNQDSWIGYYLHGLFQKLEYRLSGVKNRMDKSSYPLPKKSKEDLKTALQKRPRFKKVEKDIPLIVAITRLDSQKGIDFVIEKMDEIMSMGVHSFCWERERRSLWKLFPLERKSSGLSFYPILDLTRFVWKSIREPTDF